MATLVRMLALVAGGTVLLLTMGIVWFVLALGVVGWPWTDKDVSQLDASAWVSPADYGPCCSAH